MTAPTSSKCEPFGLIGSLFCRLFEVCVGVLACFGLFVLLHAKVEKKPPKPEPRGNVEVLAVTESGTTVYRVDGPRAIVPVVWVESKEGHVSIR